jgi:hypothetical protein
MPDKRVDALNSLNKNDYNSKYITLSDNTKIGVNLIKDLIKYFQLEFKNKYRYNYRKWTFEEITNPEKNIHKDKSIAPEGNTNADSGEQNTKTEEDTIIYKIIEGQDDDGIAIDKLKKYIKKIYSGEKQDDSNYIEIPEEIFNRDIGLRKNYRDSSINDGYIPIIVIDCDGGTPYYFKPLLEYNYTNYDFQEKSQMYDDLNKLNSIFKKSNYKDLDDLVILDFYKEFTKKVEKLKDDIISSDDDVKYDIIDNIYDKLAIIYEIKIGRNKKIVKKPIKEIVDGTGTGTNKKTPKDICDIAKEENETGKKTLFNDILCEINKRAQIFNNIKKGGKKAIRRVGGAPNPERDLNTFVNKLLTVTSGDENLRYNAYLEIDKNILEGFINNTALKEHITNLQTTKSLSNFSNMTQQFFKISPKKIYGKIDEKNITFASFNKFIEKIKDRMVEDSTRYLAIIKSLTIIMKTTLGLQKDNTQTNTPEQKGNSGEEGEKAPGETAEETAGKKAEETAEKKPAETAEKKPAETAEETAGKKPAETEPIQGGRKYGGAYQNVVSSNIRNQGNQGIQKQANEDKISGNPGKEYLKNLTDIYINLAKEYGKFIKDEKMAKKLIKEVIQSQEDKDKISSTSGDEQSDEDLSIEKIDEIKQKHKLHEEENINIEKGKAKVYTLYNSSTNVKKRDNAKKKGEEVEEEGEKEGKEGKENDKVEIDGIYTGYKKKYIELTDLKEKLIKTQKEKRKEVEQEEKDGISFKIFKEKSDALLVLEQELIVKIKSYRLRYGSGTNELAGEETKKQVNDLENQNKENEKKSKNLEERKKQLTASLKVIKEELKKLYKACIDINLPYATEYNDFVKNIIKIGQLKYIIEDNPQINNNNEIVEVYNKEIDKIDKELGDIKIDIASNTKKIKDVMAVISAEGKRDNSLVYVNRGGASYGGGAKEDEEEKDKLRGLLNGNLYKLIGQDKPDGDNNLFAFIAELKTVFDNDDDKDIGSDNASGKKYNEKETLYEKIWNDYSDGVKSYYNNQKDKNPLTYINEGEKLKNKVILYDLDPEIVLKITFQDKVVFLALMFAIRTMIMVLFEFLIDYNVVKSLRYAILIYAFFYILLLLLFTTFVNLDSYKLRIVFNYLNMHINTPGIILHIMLFIIFSLLVIIIIQTDNFINNLGDILDYTYIYNYIYTFNFDNILSGEFENNLTKDEKIKLQYRLDIISMLIFIFSGTLILLM